MKSLSAATALLPVLAWASLPEVSNVVFRQNPATRVAKVTYSVSEGPAIVSIDIQTNSNESVSNDDDGWVSIGSENFPGLEGVNGVLVKTAGCYTAVWDARGDWPDKRTKGARAFVRAWPTNAAYWAENTEFWDRVAAERAKEEAEREAAEEAARLAAHPLYMVVDLTNANSVCYYTSTNELPGGIGSDVYRTTHMLFRKIRAAGKTARLGSPSTEVGRYAAGDPEKLHYVKFTRDFYIGAFEVTQKQFLLIHGSNPSNFKNGDESVWGTRPVENVFYTFWNPNSRASKTYLRDPTEWPNYDNEAEGHVVTNELAFIHKFRAHTGLGDNLDLPTYSQWEYACRAGETNAVYNGGNLTGSDLTVQHAALDGIARYYYNASGATATAADTTGEVGTARVGSYEPNAWGLYDMLGNVDEHCLDYYGAPTNTTAAAPAVDYQGPASYTGGQVGMAAYNMHVIAGGAWNSTVDGTAYRSAAHSAQKFNAGVHVGFRLCLNIPEDCPGGH